MAQFVGLMHGPLGSVQDCHEVRNAVMATTTVEPLSDSPNQEWEIAGILSHHGRVPEEEEEEEDEGEGEGEGEQQFRTPLYLVYADEVNSGLYWSSTRMVRDFRQLLGVSIPNNVRELCDRCFQRCVNLRRVTFGSSSSLERIGVLCFERSGVEEVSIPDGVRELCDCCFRGCQSLRRVTFGSSSSLERIGFQAFPSYTFWSF